MFDLDIKPSVANFIVIVLTAIVGISLLKYLMSRWPVPGLAEVIQTV